MTILAALTASLVHFAVVAAWPALVRQPALNAVSWAVTALIAWVQLAVSARRLHDLGKTAWLLLLYVVPIAGLIILIWCFGRGGWPGPNRYGSSALTGGELAA